jgi:NAD(P)-dependent dehydrogenase (short-subunit alcohol dehydrogenase family)
MNTNSNKKVAFITGANRGLGLETARELGKLGIHVVLGVRDPKNGETAVKTLRSEGISADVIRFDVVNADDRRAAVAYFEKNFGKLDILVNNAGIMVKSESALATGTPVNRTSTSSPKALRETFDVNFFAQVDVTQALLPLIRKSPAGRIVNLSSILGSLALHSDPASPIYDMKSLAYDASKTALNAFTVHLAHELRDTNIKVNSAHPGWVKTDMGGESAPMEVSEGGKTSAQLATLPDNGPTGGFFHLGEPLPW